MTDHEIIERDVGSVECSCGWTSGSVDRSEDRWWIHRYCASQAETEARGAFWIGLGSVLLMSLSVANWVTGSHALGLFWGMVALGAALFCRTFINNAIKFSTWAGGRELRWEPNWEGGPGNWYSTPPR